MHVRMKKAGATPSGKQSLCKRFTGRRITLTPPGIARTVQKIHWRMDCASLSWKYLVHLLITVFSDAQLREQVVNLNFHNDSPQLRFMASSTFSSPLAWTVARMNSNHSSREISPSELLSNSVNLNRAFGMIMLWISS